MVSVFPDLINQLQQKGGEHKDKNLAKLNKYIQINQSSVIITKVMENLPPSKQEFNTNPYLLGFDDGVLDLRVSVTSVNLKDAFRRAEPTDYITMSVGYDFIEPVGDLTEVRDELDWFFATSIPNDADQKYQYFASQHRSSIQLGGGDRFIPCGLFQPCFLLFHKN